MNIFYLHPDARRCARWHCDRHVVKMLLETVQLLYTAHWVLAGGNPDLGSAPAPKSRPGDHGYMPVHNKNHPCAIWVRQSLQHYKWLCELGLALAVEYRHRYADRAHSCEAHVVWLHFHPPADLKDLGWTQPPKAMPDEHKRSGDSVVCYRNYYRESKGSRGLLVYTKRHRPHWITG